MGTGEYYKLGDSQCRHGMPFRYECEECVAESIQTKFENSSPSPLPDCGYCGGTGVISTPCGCINIFSSPLPQSANAPDPTGQGEGEPIQLKPNIPVTREVPGLGTVTVCVGAVNEPCPEPPFLPHSAQQSAVEWVEELLAGYSDLEMPQEYALELARRADDAEAQVKRYDEYHSKLIVENESLRAQLAAAQARERELREALERIEKCEDAPDIDATGEWQTGLFCGVEDRDCANRYEGALYGHTVGVEKALEWAVNEARAALAKHKEAQP